MTILRGAVSRKTVTWLFLQKGNRPVFDTQPTNSLNNAFHVPPATACANTATEMCRVFSSQPVVTHTRQERLNLRIRTKKWLGIPSGSWSRNEISQGRFLFRAWADVAREGVAPNNATSGREAALCRSDIVERFIAIKNNCETNDVSQGCEDVEIMEMLHQCLDSWKYVKPSECISPSGEAFKLLSLLDDTGIATGNTGLRPGNKAYSMCLAVVARDIREIETKEILQLVWERREQQPKKSDLQFYNSFLYALSKWSRHSAHAPIWAEKVIQQCSDSGHSPDTSSFVFVMHAWANRGDRDSSERSQAILEQLVQSESTMVSVEAFNVCIDGWAKVDRPENAENLLWRMHKIELEGNTRLQPTTVSFNSVINAWAKSSNPEAPVRAENLLGRMEMHGCRPSLESYTSVLDAWSRTDQPGPRVQRMLDRLEVMHDEDPTRSPAPNKLSYVIAIRSWGATIDSEDAPQRAQALVRRMVDLSTQDDRIELDPCLIVYSTLLEAWAKSSRIDAPDRLMELIYETQDKIPSSEITTLLNRVLRVMACRGLATKAHALVRDVESEGVILPDCDSYNIVMHAYAKSSDRDAADKATTLLQELQSHRDSSLRPSVRTYIHAMVALGNSQRAGAARRTEELFWQLLEESNNEDVVPKTVAANCVLRAWAKDREGGAAQKAEVMLQWMEAHGTIQGIKPDSTSFRHMMQAWAHSGRHVGPEKAEAYFSRLKEGADVNTADLVLSTAHYNLLILAWSRSQAPGATKRITELVRDMVELSLTRLDVFPDRTTKRYIKEAMSNAKDPGPLKKAMSIVNAHQRTKGVNASL